MKYMVLACSFGLAACASTGVKVDPNAMASFKVGQTTQAEVVGRLGEPTTSVVTANGERQLTYTYAEAQVRPENFIPVVGLFVGGVDSKATSVVLIFDANGVLKDHASASHKQGMGTGLISGTQEQKP